MEATVATILSRKGSNVITVIAEDNLASVANVLNRNRIGACPVVGRRGNVIGMISERDIVRKIAEAGDAALHLSVSDAMTSDVRVCGATDKVSQLMEVMTSIRARHLPVVSHGDLIGIISIGDVVKQRLEEAEEEVDALRSYIAS